MKRKVDKNREVFYRVSISDAFQDAIKEMRQELDVPLSGLGNVEKVFQWQIKLNEKLFQKWPNGLPFGEIHPMNKLVPMARHLVKEFSLPPYFLYPITDYILTNHTPFDGKKIPFGLQLIPDVRLLNQNDIQASELYGYSALLIHPTASQRDVIEFVKTQWAGFPNSSNKKRVKTKIYKQRDEQIYQKSLEGKNEYEIAREMAQEKGVKVDADHVRKIVHYQKTNRSRRTRNEAQ